MSWEDLSDAALKTAIQTFKLKVKAVYTPKDGLPIEIDGVFDHKYRAVSPQTEIPVTSTGPNLGIRLADLVAEPGFGDKVLIKDKNYEVLDFEEDGEGGATLMLNEI